VIRVKAPDIETRVDQALEKCFIAKARNVARSAARATKARIAKAAAAKVTTRVAAMPARRAARAS
jgi:hypothetical protein